MAKPQPRLTARSRTHGQISADRHIRFGVVELENAHIPERKSRTLTSNESERPLSAEGHELLYFVMSRLIGDDPRVLKMKLKEHLAFGTELHSRGLVVCGGPLLTPGGENSGTGIYALRAASLADAMEIVSQDPMHTAEIRLPTVSPWLRKTDWNPVESA